nr:uncharacterized protein LOC110001632 [Labrus bergylta]
MAGDCAHTTAHYAFTPAKASCWSDEAGEMEAAAGNSSAGRGPPARWSSNFEMIEGLLYRKKLEKGFINYREVLDEDRRHEALSTFHRKRRPSQHHLSLEETYKCVAENYWWEGMYFQIRDFVLACQECQRQQTKNTEEQGGRRCVTKTMSSHGTDMLSKLRSQREAGLFCDITLRTNGRSYSAHRAVLAAVSDHFQEIFTDMDSGMKADIDLTGFSEDSLLSLLDFSYSSTLCVRQEDLPEVIAMARHLGMWPAVEACAALMKEREQKPRHGKGFPLACHRQQRDNKKRGLLGLGDTMDKSFSLTLDASDESFDGSPRRNLRRTPKRQSPNGLPLSPTHRMKLMDFKSPSSKKATTPRHNACSPQSHNYSPTKSPPNTRLLRSTPGAAEEVQRFLPKPETPRRNKKPHPIGRLLCPSSRTRQGAACSPVRVKQEVEEVAVDEEDYARAQEKYKLMNVLGLQRTALLPRPEDLIGWRQKKRLRKLKANNYSLTKRRKPRSASPPGLPYGDVTLSLPLCNPVNTRLLSKSGKPKLTGLTADHMTTKRPKVVSRHVPPSDRSMRSKGAIPDMFLPAARRPCVGGRELRQSVRRGEGAHPQKPPRHKTNKTVVRIKQEPADDFSISGFSLPSNGSCGVAPKKSPTAQRTQARNKVPVETVRVLRYNSGRPAAKAKLRRGFMKEVEKKVDGPGQRGVVDTRPRTKVDDEPCGLQFTEQAPPPSIYNHPLYKVIKEEPADPVPVGVPFSDPPSPDLGKRQSKPPIKLLDSGFLFSFCRPAGGAMAVLKKEEESVDICLTRSVSQVREKFGATQDSPHRTLRARAPPLTVVKREREERSVSQSKAQRPRPNSRNNAHHTTKAVRSKAKPTKPKQQAPPLPLSSRSYVMTDAVSRARLKQLRGPRSQVPKLPKAAHACLQCPTSYKDCDALIMHRLRHIEGKHWPCLLCSKTFFRLRNVRNHIRTHDPKLYKCRSCIVSGS